MARLQQILEQITFGAPVAEEEFETLESYFVQTSFWRQLVNDEVDIFFGAKGSGKSALFALLASKAEELGARRVIVVPGENPRGATAFRDLGKGDPPNEPEMEDLWRLHLLALAAQVLDDYGVETDGAETVRRAVENAGLKGHDRSLAGLVRAARDWIGRHSQIESAEPRVHVDPSTGLPAGASIRIALREPSASERASGFVSLQQLLRLADDALVDAGLVLWVALDRLDVAFAGAPELERVGLRALLRIYLDARTFKALRLKIFLRSDIRARLMEGGFVEASHLTRTATIDWEPASLLVNLVTRRVLVNDALVEELSIDGNAVLASYQLQEGLLDRLLPSLEGSTFSWIVEHCRNGSGRVAPREVIQFLEAARRIQIQRLETGHAGPSQGKLFEQEAFREALVKVSKTRLEQTIYAEFVKERPFIERLEGQPFKLSVGDLKALWGTDDEQTLQIAKGLGDIGILERTSERPGEPLYVIPPIYRPSLRLVEPPDNAS